VYVQEGAVKYRSAVYEVTQFVFCEVA